MKKNVKFKPTNAQKRLSKNIIKGTRDAHYHYSQSQDLWHIYSVLPVHQ